ncbi:MAG: glycosyltransferase family 39 protein [bacterium]|nr:glycosyltransferase family 39 protein [bacterium]
MIFQENKKSLPILLVLLLAIFVRLIGLQYGLPDDFRPDERNIIQTAVRFGATGDFNPHVFVYPSLYYYTLFIVYSITYFVLYLFQHISWHQFWSIPLLMPTAMVTLARLTTVIFSVATVYLVYRLGKDAYNQMVGLLSAFLLSLTYLHVRDSHFGTTDVPSTFFFMLALWFAVRLVRKPVLQNFLWFGIFAGLAIGTKYNTGMILVALLTSYYLVIRNRSISDKEKRNKYSYYLTIAILATGVAFIISTPFALLDFSTFKSDFMANVHNLRYGHRGIDLGLGWGYHLKFTLYHGLGLPYVLAAGIGLAYALWKRTAVDYILVIQTICYYVWISSGKTVFVRYLIPLMPLIAILTARWISEMVTEFSLRKPIMNYGSSTLVSLIILSGSIYNLSYFDYLLQQKDTRTLAREWIQATIPPQTKIAMDGWQGKPQLNETEYQLVYIGMPDNKKDWVQPKYIDELIYGYNVEILVIDYHPLPYSTPPHYLQGYQPGRLLANIAPVTPELSGFGRAVFDMQDAFYIPYGNFAGYRRGGPWIRIYDITR